MAYFIWVISLFVAFQPSAIEAWVQPPSHQLSVIGQGKITTTVKRNPRAPLFAEGDGPLEFLTNPYQSKIPAELKDEIYEAEANTPAAQDRNTRVTLYALVAFLGILLAFFNAFVTGLRTSEVPTGENPLEVAGFTWVESNGFLKFFFMNKIGGFLLLIVGGGSGLMAEAELDTKRINAEKIYEELVRRKESRENQPKQKQPISTATGKKKRRSGKEKKRMKALSEIVVDEAADSSPELPQEDKPAPVETAKTKVEEKSDGGVFGKVKEFYEKADNMAASQALLLNKKLEDEGLIEKITDETGLKVIGAEEAKKLKQKEAESGQ